MALDLITKWVPMEGGWVEGSRVLRSLFRSYFPLVELCDICGSVHESYQGHVFATNAASNTVAASNNASNRSAQGKLVAPEVDVVGVRKQRWSREAYNAYQRAYMRRHRAGVR